VFRVIGTGGRGNAGTDGGGTGEAADAGADGDQVAVGDGVAITSELAQALYQRIAPLHEADQCGLLRFDTSRFRIRIGLQTFLETDLCNALPQRTPRAKRRQDRD